MRAFYLWVIWLSTFAILSGAAVIWGTNLSAAIR